MSVEDAFLDDIAEHPDDDTPRLIYADWLDEHGDADRAEFIRIQCRLARPDIRDQEERNRLQDRERMILQRQDHVWSLGRPSCFHYSRGFVEGFISPTLLSGEDDPHWFLDNAETIFARCPLLQNAYLSLKTVEAGRDGPQEVPGTLDQGVLESFSRVPGLRRLRSFALCHSTLNEEGLAWLAGSPYLTSLRRLDLTGNELHTLAIELLLEAPWLSGLTSLDLSGHAYAPLNASSGASIPEWPNIGDEEALLLAGCPALANLAELRLACNPLQPATIQALLDSPHLARLTNLEVVLPSENHHLRIMLENRFTVIYRRRGDEWVMSGC
jgi:uncharacterized protein (TIGR02996 family)